MQSPFRYSARRIAILAALFMCVADSLQPAAASPSAQPFSVQAVDAAACASMKERHVLSPNAPVRCDQLSIVRFRYVGFEGQTHDDGMLMVMTATAEHVAAIFKALYALRFPIARARLLDEYGGDDAASMRDNNTSAFNDRPVTGGGPPSLHAYGLAIDLNPVQNPYIAFDDNGRAVFEPPEGRHYANRRNPRPGKPVRRGMAEQVAPIFAAHGFLVWGGDWDAPIDYQHFQLPRTLAKKLAALPAQQAKKAYVGYVKKLGSCLDRPAQRRVSPQTESCLPGIISP